MAGAVKGYYVILVMPETMSVERRRLLKAYGAELVLTPGCLGMKGAIAEAEEIVNGNPEAWMPMKFENKANLKIYSKITANKILADFPDGIDIMLAGVGTGGHISGVGRILKERYLQIKIVAVEPADSPVISCGSPGPHKIQGIGAGFIPGNLNRRICDFVIQVRNEYAYEMTREAASQEGLLAGISTGTSLHAVRILTGEAQDPLRILCFAYDSGERYLSVEDLWNPA
ncbi:MAG: pyridoxal-phosphate dependent enzyme [Bacteroidales bacterium]